MMKTSFFNLQITNLFIGLFKRHHFLRPHCIQISKLGYKIHSIEPSFSSQGRTINPEAIVCSEVYTLMTEWTSANSLSYDKKNQIHRYLQVSEGELVSINVPPKYSVWVVVLPSSLESFQEIFNDRNKDRLLLCSFDRIGTGEYCIQFYEGSILDTKLSSILTQTMKFKRIPEGYLPIPLENFRDERFTDAVIQQLVSFIVNKNHEFSVEDICKSMIMIWDYLASDKQKAIRKAIKRIMGKISQQDYCQGWLVYNSPNWQVQPPSKSKLDKFLNFLKSDFSMD